MTPPGWDTNPSQTDAGTHLLTLEGWKAELGRKKDRTNIQILAELRLNRGPRGRKACRDLTNCINHSRPLYTTLEGVLIENEFKYLLLPDPFENLLKTIKF